MNSAEYIFEKATNEELEKLYLKFEEQMDEANMFTTEGKIYSKNAHMIYEELQRRGEELRGVYLILKRHLAETDTAELRLLYDKLSALTVGVNPVFEDDYTECGDPISDAASIMDSFKWFLQVALEERGEKVR